MKKEKNAAKPKTKRPAKPKKEPVSQWMTNPLNEQVLDYHNYEMTHGEQVLYFILAFLIGGVVSQFFYGGLFQEDGAPTLLTYISNAAEPQAGGKAPRCAAQTVPRYAGVAYSFAGS